MQLRSLINKCLIAMIASPLACVHTDNHGQDQERSIASSEQVGGYALTGETCGGFRRLEIGMRKGFCAGLVASEKDGLKFPRAVLQLPRSRFFVVADMGGWAPGLGRILILDPEANEGHRVRVVIEGLNSPHGLAIGPDGKTYVGTTQKIFRFDPLARNPSQTIEDVIRDLPGKTVKLPDGTVLDDAAHPLHHFIFAPDGSLFVNVGAPSDNCISKAPEKSACQQVEGAKAGAAIWKFQAPSNGIFPALKPGAQNPSFTIFAKGLRNSMALAYHESYPSAGAAFLQGENSRDLPDTDRPHEELNSLENGRHYGWPYCYDETNVSSEFAEFLKSNRASQAGVLNLCTNNPVYKKPFSLLPPHSAPLGMIYYKSDRFAELKGKLLIALHGYRPSGSRVLSFAVDQNGFPMKSTQATYGMSCEGDSRRPYKTETGIVAAAVSEDLIGSWHKVNGVRPQGAPVAISESEDGALWLAEDKNKTIIRIDRDSNPDRAPVEYPCNSRPEKEIQELMKFIDQSRENRARLTRIREGLVEKHCLGCHSDFNLRPEMHDDEKDKTVAHFILSQDSWLFPGDLSSSRLHLRTRGIGAEKVMPANGRELIKSSADYRTLLDDLDGFMKTLVPGVRKIVKLNSSPSLKLRGLNNKVCGSIPRDTLVIVVETKSSKMPGYARIYRPADRYLNGTCTNAEGYYLGSKYLANP